MILGTMQVGATYAAALDLNNHLVFAWGRVVNSLDAHRFTWALEYSCFHVITLYVYVAGWKY